MDDRLTSLFHRALTLSLAEREQFLIRECVGDPALLAELRSLLSYAGSELPVTAEVTRALEREAADLFAQSSEETQSLPARIGRYELGEVLGSGGSGTVVRARDPALGRSVALKLLGKRLVVDTDWISRFLREARLLAELSHPNLGGIHDVLEWDGRPVLVLEHIDGSSLARLLRNGVVPLERSLDLLQQVADALAATHARGIVHRDLNPANIVVTNSGSAKVVDFGLGKRMSDRGPDATGTHHTAKGTVMGTAGYMSPEQASGMAADARADIWAWGCVAYECLSGVPAFGGSNAVRRMRAVMSTDPDWSRLPQDVPARLTRLLKRCLAKDPVLRVSTMAEVCAELAEAKGQGAPGAALRRQSPVRPIAGILSPLRGRDTDLAAVLAAMTTSRLVTVAGPAGSGKSRLAREVAASLKATAVGEVRVVSLLDVPDGAGMLSAVASGIEHPSSPGDGSAEAAILRTLDERVDLLVLDSAEHLVPEVGSFATRALHHCPRTRVLVTSRQRLRVAEERVHVLAPLDVPAASACEPTELRDVPSVQLFLDRAASSRPGFALTHENGPWVASICRQLDGIPLALELAASRMSILSPREVAGRLERCVALLSSAQSTEASSSRSLRAALDWSHGLLSDRERILYRRLGVFHGGWTIEAVERTCCDDQLPAAELLDLLDSLSDKSLTAVDASGSMVRHFMLEPLRQHAAEALASAGEAVTLRARHAAYHLELAREASDGLRGQDAVTWIGRLDAEHRNLRATILSSLETEGDPVIALSVVALLKDHWIMRGHVEDGLRLAVAAIQAGQGRASAEVLGKCLVAAAALARHVGDPDARSLLQRALELLRTGADAVTLATALHNLGEIELAESRHHVARELLQQSLEQFRASGDRRGTAAALYNLSIVASLEGDDTLALQLVEESLKLTRLSGNEAERTRALARMGVLARERGDVDTALSHFRECLATFERLGSVPGQASLRYNIGTALAQASRWAEARESFDAALRLQRQTGNLSGMAQCLHGLGHVALRDGRTAEAARQLVDAIESFDALGRPDSTTRAMQDAADLLGRLGEHGQTLKLLGAIQAIRSARGLSLPPAEAATFEEQVARAWASVAEQEGAAAWEDGQRLASGIVPLAVTLLRGVAARSLS